MPEPLNTHYNNSLILEVKSLSVDFRVDKGFHTAVNGISFTLEKGKTIGLVGESGSGKSVSALSIMRLLSAPPARVTGENILFHSNETTVDLLKASGKEMQAIRGNRISMIFQEPMTSLNPVYKCGPQVAETLMLHKKLSKKAACERTLEMFNEVKLPRIKQIFNSYPHQLSGGQKQRVMIAMAIACKPEILIADEPTTALDVTVQKSVLELLKSLQEKYGMSMIFITHDLGVVAEIADEIAVMYQGELVEFGKKAEILKSPSHPYTKGLLACKPRHDVHPRKLPTVPEYLQYAANGKEPVTDLVPDSERKAAIKRMTSENPLLEINNLSMWFPVKHGLLNLKKEFVKAVNDVSFQVYPGETLGLVGESGCGKTTLGRTILRMVEPSSGNISFKGMNLTGLSTQKLRRLRKKIQIIFQDPYSSLNPRIPVGYAVMEPMKVHGIFSGDKERKRKVIELLERVNLEERHYNLYPHEFSGGQRQRICIARALAVEPEFIICDESVSALDVSVQAQVLNLLNKLKKDFGLTYIFISHDLSVVKYMSDRMIVMKNGEIVEMGEADEIYKNPASDYTRKLIDSIPVSYSN